MEPFVLDAAQASVSLCFRYKRTVEHEGGGIALTFHDPAGCRIFGRWQIMLNLTMKWSGRGLLFTVGACSASHVLRIPFICRTDWHYDNPPAVKLG